MPWWNDRAAGLTPAVTIDRVAAWFDANGFTYGRSENGSAIVTGFDEYSYVVAVVDGNLMVTHARFWTNLPDDARSLAALRELINRLNQSRTIPSLSTFADEDGRQLAAEIAGPRHRPARQRRGRPGRRSDRTGQQAGAGQRPARLPRLRGPRIRRGLRPGALRRRRVRARRRSRIRRGGRLPGDPGPARTGAGDLPAAPAPGRAVREEAGAAPRTAGLGRQAAARRPQGAVLAGLGVGAEVRPAPRLRPRRAPPNLRRAGGGAGLRRADRIEDRAGAPMVRGEGVNP